MEQSYPDHMGVLVLSSLKIRFGSHGGTSSVPETTKKYVNNSQLSLSSVSGSLLFMISASNKILHRSIDFLNLSKCVLALLPQVCSDSKEAVLGYTHHRVASAGNYLTPLSSLITLLPLYYLLTQGYDKNAFFLFYLLFFLPLRVSDFYHKITNAYHSGSPSLVPNSFSVLLEKLRISHTEKLYLE